MTINPANGIVQPNQSGTFNVRATNPGWIVKSFKYRIAGGSWQESRVAPNTTFLSPSVSCPATGGAVEGVAAFEQKVEWTVTSSVENPASDNAGTITPLGQTTYTTADPAAYEVKPNEGWVVEWVKVDNVAVQAQANNIYQVTYDASKTSRTIKDKFKLACLTAKPEDTIKALRAGQPAQINTKTFREWVGQTGNYSLDGKSYTSVEEMVKAEMERGQCEYVEDLYSWYDNYTKIRNSFIQTLKSIKPVIEMKRPALFGVLIFETGAHSVVALDVKELPSPLLCWFGAKI